MRRVLFRVLLTLQAVLKFGQVQIKIWFENTKRRPNAVALAQSAKALKKRFRLGSQPWAIRFEFYGRFAQKAAFRILSSETKSCATSFDPSEKVTQDLSPQSDRKRYAKQSNTKVLPDWLDLTRSTAVPKESLKSLIKSYQSPRYECLAPQRGTTRFSRLAWSYKYARQRNTWVFPD